CCSTLTPARDGCVGNGTQKPTRTNTHRRVHVACHGLSPEGCHTSTPLLSTSQK
uniref:Uncharacterized protein n=1 Tax=Strix occidentalis caurina TaxID=311401 RepID=A0A8D0F144_STROC